ncbi:hypothetical protein ABZ901_12270, partial [Actinacidiphila alni]
VLWPPPSAAALPDDGPNDASVALLVHTGGLTLLLMGDLEPAAQEELMTDVPDLPRVDVLKVAHHGSAYQDPDLLARVHPRLALISVGADNPYGHPSARTVTALRALGAVVLRTDTDGPIAVSGTAPGELRTTLAGSGSVSAGRVPGRRGGRRPTGARPGPRRPFRRPGAGPWPDRPPRHRSRCRGHTVPATTGRRRPPGAGPAARSRRRSAACAWPHRRRRIRRGRAPGTASRRGRCRGPGRPGPRGPSR